MELIISVALGAWISIGGWVAYKALKEEYVSIMKKGDSEK